MHVPPRPARLRRSRRRGFTLLEVLLVLAILGVIAAMVVPQLIGQRQQANIDATRINIRALEGALELYALDHDGEFPPTNLGLEALIVPPPNDPQWKRPYLKDTQDLPRDAWGNPFQYQYPGQHHVGGTRPDIWSWGPDKASGTDDDLTNWGPAR